MIKKIEKFEVLNGSKKDCGKNYLYSQIIRNERLKRRLTLQEIAKGICSVSYLCKFEKNLIIADEEYIRAIFERVNMDYSKVGLNIIEDGVKNAVKAYLYQQYSEIENYFSMIDDTLFNAQNYLIKGFYYLIKEDFVEFKDIIATIDNIKDTLMVEDVGVFMFLVVEYYIITNQFTEAAKYLKYMDALSFELKEINWLISEQQFIVGYNLKKYPVMYRYYKKLMDNFDVGYPSKRQLLIRLMMLDCEATDYFKDAFEEIQHIQIDLNIEYSLDIYYWKLVVMLKGNMWFDVYEAIMENNLHHEAKFAALLMYTADLINDQTYINQAVELVKELDFQENDVIHQKFIKFLMIKFTEEKKYAIIEYLKYEIIPFNSNFTHHLYSDVYDKHYLDFLCNTSKYKDALYYMKKICN